MPCPSRFLLVPILLLAVACAKADESSTTEASSRASDGRYASLPPGTDSIMAERTLLIGKLDGEPEYAFGQIYAIRPAPHGGFYTCDQNDLRIRRYDAAGVFTRYVGKKGSGPGEYGYCMDLAIMRDSSLVVSDPMNGRFVFFGKDGEFTRVMTAVVGGGLGGGDAFMADTSGRFWKKAWLATEGGSESDRPTQYVIFSPDGARVDSVRIPPPGNSAGRGFMLCTSGGCYNAQPVDSISAIGPSGLVAVASPSRFHVRLSHPDGRVTEITRDDRPVPYAKAERAEWEAWRTFLTKQDPQYPPSAIRDAKPILRDLRIDELDRIWVHVHVAAEKRPVPPRPPGDPRPLLTWRERNTYDLFTASGDYIGRVTFSDATELMASRGDRVWLREEGSSGEHLIGIYDLRPAKR